MYKSDYLAESSSCLEECTGNTSFCLEECSSNCSSSCISEHQFQFQQTKEQNKPEKYNKLKKWLI